MFVAIVGINRSTSTTAPFIKKFIIEPLRMLPGLDVSGKVLFLMPPENRVNNPRSKEFDYLEPPFARDLDFPVLGIGSSVFRRADIETHASQESPGQWSDGGKSFLNLYYFLAALDYYYYNSLKSNKHDVVLFTRPDLLPCGAPFRAADLRRVSKASAKGQATVLVPGWGGHDGINDRFALLSSEACAPYFTRVRLFSDFFAHNPKGNSEQLLAYALREIRVFSVLDAPLIRIRVGGRPHEADTSLFRMPSRIP